MPLNFGSNSITSAKVGSTDVSRIMLGSTQVFPTVSLPAGTTRYGALTRAGEGGIPVTGSSITNVTAGSTSDWQIVGGEVTPSATGEDSLPLGAVTITFNDATTLDLNIEAGKYAVQMDEIVNRMTAVGASAMGYFVVGPADQRAAGRIRFPNLIYPTEVIVEPGNWTENSDPRLSMRPITTAGLTIGGDLATGNINNRMENLTVQGLICQMTQGPSESESNNGIIRVERPSRHVTIRQNEIWSRDTREIEVADDFRDNLDTCRMLRGIATSVEQNGAANEHIRIEHNHIHDVSRGVIMTATNEYGGQRSRLCNNIMEECYTNFYTIGYLNGLDIFDNKCMGISAQLQDTLGAIPATSPHASTGLSGDAGGSRTTRDVTAMGNFQHIGWLRKSIQEELGKTVGDTAATGAKFNDPRAFDSYYNIIFAFNTIVSHGFSLELSGAAADNHNLIFNNSLIYESYIRDGSPPILAFGGVTDGRMFNNLSTSYDIHGEDGGSNVDGVQTLTTLESYGNVRLGLGTSGFGEENYFVGHPMKGFAFLTLDEAVAAYVPVAGSRALTADQPKGATGHGLYSGNGVYSLSADFDKPAPSGGTSHTYATTTWTGQYLEASGAGGNAAATGLTIALQGRTVATLDGLSRRIFSMSGQRVNLNKNSNGQLEFRIEKAGNELLYRGLAGGGLDQDRFDHDDGKTSLLCSFNFTTGAVHMMVNGQLINWVSHRSIDSGTLSMSGGSPRLFANELTARGSNWEGELDLFYLDDTYYDLEQVANIDRFLATDGYFKNFGTDGSSPGGSQPLIYVAGTAAEITATPNRGRGGAMVLAGGAITDVGGPVNSAPIANVDTETTDRNTAITFDPRSNDTDVNGDTLTITAATLASGPGAVTSFTGTSISYDPQGSTGTAVINYTISDGNGGSDSSTATVTVTAPGGAGTTFTVVGSAMADVLGIALPSGTQAGDIAIINSLNIHNTSAFTTPSGWTSLGQHQVNSDRFSHLIGRILDGTEGSGTFAGLTGSGSRQSSLIVILRPAQSVATLVPRTDAGSIGLNDADTTMDLSGLTKPLLGFASLLAPDPGSDVDQYHDGPTPIADVALGQTAGVSGHMYAWNYRGADTLSDFSVGFNSDSGPYNSVIAAAFEYTMV